MITDYGLSIQPMTNPRPALNGRTILSLGFNYLAVGIGSTAPNASQTSLVLEVARTLANGGASESETNSYDPATNSLVSTGNLVREITFTSSYNLTEFGFFTDSYGNNCVYRQLFRQDPNDPNSAPMVIPVEAGDKLRIRYSVSWIVPLDVVGPISVNINGVQANLKTFIGRPQNPLAYMFHPYQQNPLSGSYGVTPTSYYTFNNRNEFSSLTGVTYYPSSNFSVIRTVVGNSVTYSMKLLTDVTFSSARTVFFTSSVSNNNPQNAVIVFAFDVPISKNNLQEMSFTYTLSWRRT